MAVPSVDNHYVALVSPSLDQYANRVVFRRYLGSDNWGSVTYRELQQQLSVAQTHWRAALSPFNLKRFEVVGFWLTGRKLADIVNTLSVSSLGYTPQFFGSFFTHSPVILELLEKSGGKVLIADSSLIPQISGQNRLPLIPSLDEAKIKQLIHSATVKGHELKFTTDVAVAPDDTAALFHSSGTTGTTPKIIPNTFKMIRSTLVNKFNADLWGLPDGAQMVWNTVGNLAHVASFHCFIASVHIGGCTAQTSSMSVGPQELLGLIRVCKLNTLGLYATFLSDLINAARSDPEIGAALKGLKQIAHTGVALNKDNEDWAYTNGLNIICSYGTTETAQLLRSRYGKDAADRAMRPIPGVSVTFLPYSSEEDSGTAAHSALYEAVVPAGTDDCPPPSLCAEDGYYHTGDLFARAFDGWVYRGRAGDWIKLLVGFCDTKSAEDYVRAACADLIHDAVVVGTGRALPCLVVEADKRGGDDSDQARADLARLVVKRIADRNARVFAHERIEDAARVFVVAKGELPRTKEKGNVRRGEVEDMFANEMDAVAGVRA